MTWHARHRQPTAAMRSPLLLVSLLFLSAAAVANAQAVPPGWRMIPRPSPTAERWFLDLQSPLTAMVNVRESGRTVIDAPSLGEWLTRMVRSELAPAGGRWNDAGQLMGKSDANLAMYARTFVSTRGVPGMVQYGATSGDGRQGRVITAVFGTQAAMEGPRGVMARDLFMELMMAEVAAGQKAPPTP